MAKESIFKDRRGEVICYGDILRIVNPETRKMFESEFAPKEPFFMLCNVDGCVMMYSALGNGYVPIIDCKLSTDKINELGGFEIFAHREIYELVNEVNKQ